MYFRYAWTYSCSLCVIFSYTCIVCYIGLHFLQVQWTPVIWGIILQFVLGMIILRWPTGYAVCQFIGDQVTAFLAYTDNGSRFVFGDEGLKDHPVVFKVSSFVFVHSNLNLNLLYLAIIAWHSHDVFLYQRTIIFGFV